MTLSLAEQVDQRIDQVNDAHAAALAELRDRFFQTDAVEAATAALKSLRPPIDAWADKGAAALAGGGQPGAAGWPGWIRAGQELIDGIGDIHNLGVTQTLADITATKRDIERDTADVAKKIGRVAKSTALEAVDVAGKATSAIATPLALPLAVVGIVAVGALFIFVGGKLR